MVDREQLKEKYGDEKVLVVPEVSLLKELALEEGFSWLEVDALQGLPKAWVLRHMAEYNSQYKQLIPYIVINRGSRFLCTRRLEKSGEARLVNKYSLGIGGHINPVDYTIEQATRRELHEELNIASGLPLRFLGLINDTSNSVSQDHLGLLYIINLLPSEHCSVREEDKLEGYFYTLNELSKLKEEGKLESWSEIVLSLLIKSTYSHPEARITVDW